MTRYMPAQARSCRISSRFGSRGQAFHWGVDFAAADGTMIYAPQAGSVQFIGPADGFGQWIVVDHPTEAGSGTTLYAHMWDAPVFAKPITFRPASTSRTSATTVTPTAHTCISRYTRPCGKPGPRSTPSTGSPALRNPGDKQHDERRLPWPSPITTCSLRSTNC